MSIRESIGKMPVWKAMLGFLLILFFCIVGIEELFVSRIFNLLEKSITYFEKEKKQELSDYEKGEKDAAQFEKEWRNDFEDLKKADAKREKKFKQIFYCNKYRTFKRDKAILEKDKNLSPHFLESVQEELTNLADDLEKAKKRNEFDSTNCEKTLS